MLNQKAMEIEYEEWVRLYQPKQNLIGKHTPYNGMMFETDGEDLKFVENKIAKDEEHVWTLVDCDNENQYIIPGFHLVNRAGYFITKKPWRDADIEVNVNEKITIGNAKYACIEFLEDVLGLDSEEFEDKVHDFFSKKF